MCQQCRYERDFFRASDFTGPCVGELVRANPSDQGRVPEAGSDLQMLYFDQWADEEIQLIAPPFFEVETDRSLDQRHSGGEN